VQNEWIEAPLDAPGDTAVCKWWGNKHAAYSVGGDDCLTSQIEFAIPEMTRRGIFGTWWVNCGLGADAGKREQCWVSRSAEWIEAAKAGHDFANHTLHHKGAEDYADADHEIGENARIIREVNPGQGRLLLFLSGGGTTWGISREEREELVRKYDCVSGRGGGIEDPTWDLYPNAATLTGYVDRAIDEGSWHLIGLHGVGPDCEWGGFPDGDAFLAMLDYLHARRDEVWAGTHTRVHKYVQERDTAHIDVLETADRLIHVRLTSDKDPALYDHPLTLRTRVPAQWSRCTVVQGESTARVTAGSGVVQYDALPGTAEIRITPES
jgi:hypothetical protein